MTTKSKVIVILPALNAEKTLEKTVQDISKNIVDEIILVDDGSTDDTVNIAKRLGLTVYTHEKNKGYGANQKTCYRLALEKKADIIVMIHPDYQYDAKVIKYLVGFIEEGYCDVMLGSRIRSRKQVAKGGMPFYKYISNRFLTLCENILSGYNLAEWHTGMRAYKREVLENIDFKNNSDDFIFDTQVLFQIVEKEYDIGDIPVPVRYHPESSSINFKRSLTYGLLTLYTAIKFFLKKLINRK
ncbi:glycosyl transferase family 2 [Candidatus Nomurabacteria bacterium CG_4_9_14_0_2_um_filter_32_10]|uniref:Glycosyl transferase family 2 n=3 Tax=Candidatus Nomuraibacteriota TaxID=1752729 RepID=A0A2H0CGX6_9BACT|nr:MAG: glycosyl transferase family 2 [Candidatus Nomurabacteria bacterium CG22_combo_CG10-13_8_21_14_all_32_8]PIZ86260.1 MAG: glycosyl transferase family 2 [Candidatus Nomurabacteria bacterium CG_4_10_14_0_2_um_filter_33_9]PJC49120.1 MAG: glycosyl transferase family 2 [Candidatus Nomurabacteria bacterium CG_4_9_14_0_2_um_filter_32_10]